VANPKKLLSELSKSGPHKVLRGDMAIVGLPGTLYTPSTGKDLPGIAFGHGWLTGAKQYYKTLAHLASWGIVAAAPTTEKGILASDEGLATDLETTLSVISEVRLGAGDITVHKQRLGLAGHGFGASAATLAASRNSKAKALAALYPAPTSSAVLPAAADVRKSSLILVAPGELESMTSNALALRRALAGQAVLRMVPKSDNRGLAEGFSVRGRLGAGGNNKKTQKLTRAVLTGFLLHQLTGDVKYAAFSDPGAELGKLMTIDPEALPPGMEDIVDPVTKLLKSH
jgi:dienelactone hydrolase